MSKLNTHVFVEGTWYRPGEIPDDIAAKITNPKVWDGDPPQLPQEPAKEPNGDDPGPAQEPPRGGAGSGADAWRTFLTGQGVEDLPDNASREDLVALWDARKIQG